MRIKELKQLVKAAGGSTIDAITCTRSNGTITDLEQLKSLRTTTLAVDTAVAAVAVGSAIALGKGVLLGAAAYVVVGMGANVALIKTGAYEKLYNKVLDHKKNADISSAIS